MAVNCIAFNHNGNLLVTGAADGIIRLFGKTVTEPAHTIPWCDNRLTLHLSSVLPDMQRYESVMSWKAHDGEVYSVEFSYDENTVFSIGEDGKVSVCVCVGEGAIKDFTSLLKHSLGFSATSRHFSQSV